MHWSWQTWHTWGAIMQHCLCPPTLTADWALSYFFRQRCFILVYSTWGMECWGRTCGNLICKGMCECVFYHCTGYLWAKSWAKQEAPFKQLWLPNSTTLRCLIFTWSLCSRLPFLSPPLSFIQYLSPPLRVAGGISDVPRVRYNGFTLHEKGLPFTEGQYMVLITL